MPDTIVYFKNGIGNFICLTPAIQALASMDKSKKVDFCVPSDWKDSRCPAILDILENWSLVENVVRYPDQKFTKEYKTWFWFSHVEASDAYNVFLKKGKRRMAEVHWGASNMHETEYYMHHVWNMGYKGGTPKQFMPISDGPILQRSGRFFIGLCNGAFGSSMWDKKRWPYFDELSRVLRLYYDCEIVKIGGGKELHGVGCDHDFVGKLSITQTAYVMKQLDILITTDSGNMHVADALEIPLIALFGGTYVSKNKPISKESMVLRSGVVCQPCQGNDDFNTCDKFECMEQIGVGDVMAVLTKKMHVLYKTEEILV